MYFLNRNLITVYTVALASLMTCQSAYARPGQIATTPLFLSSSVDPNIFLSFDNSNSMSWTTMVEDGTGGFDVLGGTPQIKGNKGNVRQFWLNPEWRTIYRTVLPPTEWAADPSKLLQSQKNTWIFRNHHGNPLYYNPATTYRPWVGKDKNGDDFENADPLATFKQPYYRDDPNSSRDDATNLTVAKDYTIHSAFGCNSDCNLEGAIYLPTYYIWLDEDPEDPTKKIMPGDRKTKVEIKEFDADGEENTFSYTDAAGNTQERSYEEELQNFANWFQYYRSRELSAKASIGRFINNAQSNQRMGLEIMLRHGAGTDNADGSGNENDGGDTDVYKEIATMGEATNKADLLKELYRTENYDRTPTQATLERVGRYFMRTDNNAPIFTRELGGQCQKNFNLLVTDGFWTPLGKGKQRNPVTIFEKDEEGVVNNDLDGDGNRSTVADVAKYFYDTDLRSDLEDRVSVEEGGDTATHQHLVTYGIGFGVKGLLDPKTDDPEKEDFKGWGNPVPNDNKAEKIDDLFHAAYNTTGKYVSAANPDKLVAALDSAMKEFIDRTEQSFSAVSINSVKLSEGSTVYSASFKPGIWSGNLSAFKIKKTAEGEEATGELEEKPVWDAATKLSERTPDRRHIITFDGSNGIPFQWEGDDGNITDDQKKDFSINPSGIPDTAGSLLPEKRLDYVRGDTSDEGTLFRVRDNLPNGKKNILGDMVNSSPVYVGEPRLSWPDTAPFPTGDNSYTKFRTDSTVKGREAIVYIGANDGMLHGFAAGSGEEKIAYVPSSLFSDVPGQGLHHLSDTDYEHRDYVDLTPTISDVFIDGAWKTILIGGLRGGGRSIFSLDITDPSLFSETNASQIVNWEFSDADLGLTFSQPQIGLANGSSGSNKWVAIVGNGYNATGDGKAKLFIIDVKDGSVIKEITAGDDGTPEDPNGLSTPTLADTNGDGTIDRAYAGDLYGNMWAFNLSSDDSGNWDRSKLFTTDNAKPITTRPTLSKHPTIGSNASNSPNLMVFFGTGQYLTREDLKTVDADGNDKPDDSFYGIWDKSNGTTVSSGSLVEQVLTNTTATTSAGDTIAVRTLTQEPVDYLSGDMLGWKIKLPTTGERSITRPVVRGEVIFFNTFIPDNLGNPCSAGGSGFRMAVDLGTGGSPDEPIFDVDGDNIVDEKDNIAGQATDPGAGAGTVVGIGQEGFLPEPVFIEDIVYTGDNPAKVKKLRTLPTGRFSWQELLR